MPPDGYETVTLPAELVAELDEFAQATGAQSRADAVEALLEGYDHRVAARVEAFDDGALDDVANVLAPRLVRELEGALR